MAALNALSHPRRRVIQMFYFDACSYRQIADQLAASVPAVKSMLHRARQQLKKEVMRRCQKDE